MVEGGLEGVQTGVGDREDAGATVDGIGFAADEVAVRELLYVTADRGGVEAKRLSQIAEAQGTTALEREQQGGLRPFDGVAFEPGSQSPSHRERELKYRVFGGLCVSLHEPNI